MIKKMVMPSLGLTMTKGMILRWIIQLGGRVERGNLFFEVRTDTNNVVEAPETAYFRPILAAEALPQHRYDIGGGGLDKTMRCN